MIKAFFFDIDDTLYSHKDAQEYAINELSRMANHLTNIPPVLFKKLFYEIYSKTLELNEKKGVDVFNKKDVFRKIYNLSPYSINEEIVKLFAEKYYEKILEKTIAFEDAEPTLTFLKDHNFKIGVISNGLRNIQLARLEKLNLISLFNIEHIVISEDVGINKPHPNIFLYAFKRLQVRPQESVMVGDDLVRDIKAAKTLDMLTIWFNRSMSDSLLNTHEVIYADFIIRNLRDIFAIVQELTN